MLLNRKRAQKYLQKFDFESLFIEELGWDTIAPVTLGVLHSWGGTS